MSELFDDIAPGQDPVAQDWQELHHMPRTSTAAQWRRSRSLSEVVIKAAGWYIDIAASQSIRVLRNSAST